ncbi:MAG: hypothetical protein VB858_09610 [Planctomycetaceae bacterium]
MKRPVLSLSTLALVAALFVPVKGAAPVKVSDILDATQLADEVKAKIVKLDQSMADKGAFERALKFKTIATDAGVIACLAQAIAEHEKGPATGMAAASLRDAALRLSRARTMDNARTELAAVEAAVGGKKTDARLDHPWNKLINMHRMMEEMEYREGRIRRTLRRPRTLPRDSSHATVLTVLALAMESDTHEVKQESDLPDWKTWSREYRMQAAKLRIAMQANKADEARKLFAASTKVCASCHEKFRD